jgi:cardiolipin synthase A/B
VTIAPEQAPEGTTERREDAGSRLRRTIEGVIGVPATEGNRIDVLRNGDEIFPAMLDAIRSAENTIDLLTFVYWKGQIGREFAHTLAARARAGVRVRVLLDGWGARPIERSLVVLMERSGVLVRWFRPLHRLHPGQVNHRTHRKVMIVDEATAFTGGVGIADEWLGNAANECQWRDTHFCIAGPAVDGLRAAFLDNWVETDPVLIDERIDQFPHQPKPGNAVVQCVRGASEVGHSDVLTLFRALCQLAQRRIRIATAYFVPDDEVLARLVGAADRGVEVELLLPGPHADKRFVQLASERDYDALLAAGVNVWTFQPSMLHAKIMTVDGLLANVGSANLNSRSTMLDEEINLVAIDPALVALLDKHFDDDLARSTRMEARQWEQRPLANRVAEAAVRPIRRFF